MPKLYKGYKGAYETRIFGGKRYNLRTIFLKRIDADREAKSLRKRGFVARVIWNKAAARYLVYAKHVEAASQFCRSINEI